MSTHRACSANRMKKHFLVMSAMVAAITTLTANVHADNTVLTATVSNLTWYSNGRMPAPSYVVNGSFTYTLSPSHDWDPTAFDIISNSMSLYDPIAGNTYQLTTPFLYNNISTGNTWMQFEYIAPDGLVTAGLDISFASPAPLSAGTYSILNIGPNSVPPDYLGSAAFTVVNNDIHFSYISGGSLVVQGGGTPQPPISPNCTWTSNSGSFENTQNWQDGNGNQRVPSSSDNLFFNNPNTYTTSLSSDHTVQNATISSGNVALSGSSLNVSSTLSVSNGARFSTGGTNITTGSLNNSGIFTHSGPGTLKVNGNTTNAAGGNMGITGKMNTSGTFTNSGTLTAYSQLSAQTFTQTSSGVLNVQLGNSNYVPIVTGAANLGGRLNVSFTDGFKPVGGNSYQVLSSNSLTGSFNNGSPLVQAGTGYLKIDYSDAGVSLVTTSVISFYVEGTWNNGGAGHAFVGLSKGDGSGEYKAGLVPGTLNPFQSAGAAYALGFIQNESSTPWNAKITYAISDATYYQITQTILHDTTSPPIYWLFGNNCVDWSSHIADIASVQLPTTRTTGGAASDPYVFLQSLLSIGDGGTYHGGIVSLNTGTGIPSPNQPNDVSFSSLESAAHSNASGVATKLGVLLESANLGRMNANDLTGLCISIIGPNTSTNLISMDWGDGSQMTDQDLSLTHIYAPGTYTAELIVIDAGAVHEYTMTVLVSSDVGSNAVIDVTPFEASTTPNLGLDPAKVPEPASLLLMLPATLLWTMPRKQKMRSINQKYVM